MARYVKISTIGVPQVTADPSLSLDDARTEVERYLTDQVAPVLPDRPDLILLPEMCDIPGNYDKRKRMEYAGRRGVAHIEFFSKIARENKCNVGFCTYRYGGGDFLFNTLYIINRSGEVAGRYNKNHIVIPGELEQNVLCGTEAPIIDLDIGRVACIICFDLNFDVLRERYIAQKPEIVLFSSMYHGGLRQELWALTCQSYFVGSVSGSRPSAILSPMGETLAYTTNYTNHVTRAVNLDFALAHLDYNTENIARMKRALGPDVIVHDPGNLGYLMLTNENPDTRMTDILIEFGITQLRDYMAGALAAQSLPENRADDC